MAAIDPTAEPASDGPKRATLKIIRRPISAMYDDMDSDEDSEDEDSEDEDSEEEESDKEETSKKKGKKGKKGGKKDEEDKMDVDGEVKKSGMIGLEDLSDDDDDLEGLELEEFVVCTLDAEKVGRVYPTRYTSSGHTGLEHWLMFTELPTTTHPYYLGLGGYFLQGHWKLRYLPYWKLRRHFP